MNRSGLVSAVIPFSCVDGPGNRFVVFLQGCNFDCVACHNPHTINVCSNCGECVSTCPSGALTVAEDGTVRWSADTCTGSEQCIATCPEASRPTARHMTVDDLVDQISRVAPFVSGVTVSGGEATQQPLFVAELFDALAHDDRLAHLTRFVDSNGSCPRHVWHDLAPVMHGAMIDLKAVDDDVHRAITGSSNADVLRSIRLLSDLDRLYEVRLLMIPGVNDTDEQVARAAAFIASVDPWVRVKVIGVRCHGVRPHPLLGREPDEADRVRYIDLLHAEGLHQLLLV